MLLLIHRKCLLPLVLTCAAVPAAAASASASPITLTHHDVMVEGEYAYSISSKHTSLGFQRTSDLVAKGKLASSVGKLTFAYDADGRPQDVTQMRADYDLRVQSSGSFDELETSEHNPPHRRSCAIGEAEGAAPASGYVERSLLQPLVGTDVAMDIRLFESLPIPYQPGAGCTGLGPVLSSDAWTGQGRFDASFDLPREAVTAGKTIQLVSGPSAEPCPGVQSPDVTGCSLTWSAKITFVKTGQEVIGGEDPGQASSPSTTPTPVPAVPAPAPARSEQAMVDSVSKAVRDYLAGSDASDGAKADAVSRALREYLAASEASDTAKVGAVSRAIQEYLQKSTPSVSDQKAQVDVPCPGTCTGTLSASAIATRNAQRGTALGRVPLRTGAGIRAATASQPARVRGTLRFSAADRRALRRAKFVALTVRVTPAGTTKAVVVRRVVRAPR